MIPDEKVAGLNPGSNTSEQPSSTTLGGASDRTLTEEGNDTSAQKSERQEGRGISHDRGEEERPRNA